MDILNENTGFSALKKIQIIETNKRKFFKNLIFFKDHGKMGG
jgi:hypothetical protein